MVHTRSDGSGHWAFFVICMCIKSLKHKAEQQASAHRMKRGLRTQNAVAFIKGASCHRSCIQYKYWICSICITKFGRKGQRRKVGAINRQAQNLPLQAVLDLGTKPRACTPRRSTPLLGPCLQPFDGLRQHGAWHQTQRMVNIVRTAGSQRSVSLIPSSRWTLKSVVVRQDTSTVSCVAFTLNNKQLAPPSWPLTRTTSAPGCLAGWQSDDQQSSASFTRQ